MLKSIPREAFFNQLAEKAMRAHCFIYVTGQQITLQTSRLELPHPTLTHTGWGLNEQQVWLEFYCFGKGKTEQQAVENRERFQKLLAHKDEIESAFGESLIWDFEPARIKQSVISRTPEAASPTNLPFWGTIQDDLIARAIRFEAALKPFLQ
jgi:hypothetical protein